MARFVGNRDGREALSRALALERAGRLDEAEALHRESLAGDPECRQSLQFLAGRAYRRGDYAMAAGYTQRYLALDPDNTDALRGLGQMLEHLGRPREALGCFARVLALAPRDPRSLLFLGVELAELGERIAAISAASLIESGLRQILAAGQDAPALANFKERATRLSSLLAEYRREIIDRAVGSAGHATADADRDRVARAVWRPEAADFGGDRRRPNYFYVPGLPDRPWFDPDEFSWARGLAACTDELAAEVSAELDLDRDLDAYVDAHLGQVSTWRNLAGRTDWGSLHFFNAGRCNQQALDRFPGIAAVLDELPLAQMGGTPIEALLSVLKPRTEIPPHAGMFNHRLTVHLPLIVPSGCGVEVAGETRDTKTGKLLIFDDSYMHRAWNTSDRPRIVLIFEILNPLLDSEEHKAIARMTEEMLAFETERKRTIEDAIDRAALSPPTTKDTAHGFQEWSRTHE